MLVLPIKKKWFDMIVSGEKKEEYPRGGLSEPPRDELEERFIRMRRQPKKGERRAALQRDRHERGKEQVVPRRTREYGRQDDELAYGEKECQNETELTGVYRITSHNFVTSLYFFPESGRGVPANGAGRI